MAGALLEHLERITFACMEKIVTFSSMRPYSQDLRERIVQALQAQEDSQTEIAQRFAVSCSFVEKLWRRWRMTGRCAALPHAGGRQRSLQAAEAVLRRAVAQQPDRMLAELCERVVQAGGARVSAKTMCLELQRLRLPRKKSPSMRGNRTRPG
jgi:transposase